MVRTTKFTTEMACWDDKVARERETCWANIKFVNTYSTFDMKKPEKADTVPVN